MGKFNAEQVLENLEKLIQDGKTVFIDDVYEDLSIFDWFPEKLPLYRLREMKQFLKEAIKLGFTGHVCFKVGASGCANGMWAHKAESANGCAPDGDCLYRSFTPDYTYWSVTINGKWYPEAYGLAYDSCETVNDIEKLINRICGGNINE